MDRFCRAEREKILSNMTPSTNYADLRHTDMVIEAVFEDLSLKHKVIQEIEKVSGSPPPPPALTGDIALSYSG